MRFAIAEATNTAAASPNASGRTLRGMLLVAVLLLGLAAPALASLYEVQWDAALFGSLKQDDTNCSTLSCGPTSAVNSFVFLQNRYPGIYGNRLVGNTHQDWVDTANLLLGPDYMDTQCCLGPQGGTSPESFISGKRKYFDAFAPGTTTVHSQEQPTWQFLFEELKRGQDIEILIGFYGRGTGRVNGHWVTVTGMMFDDVNNNQVIDADEATISFVDPLDGNAAQNPLTVRSGFLEMPDYWVDGLASFIEVAVAESPVSEPGTVLLLLFGIAALRAFAAPGPKADRPTTTGRFGRAHASISSRDAGSAAAQRAGQPAFTRPPLRCAASVGPRSASA